MPAQVCTHATKPNQINILYEFNQVNKGNGAYNFVKQYILIPNK